MKFIKTFDMISQGGYWKKNNPEKAKLMNKRSYEKDKLSPEKNRTVRYREYRKKYYAEYYKDSNHKKKRKENYKRWAQTHKENINGYYKKRGLSRNTT